MGIEHAIIAFAIIIIAFPLVATFAADYLEDTRRNLDSLRDAKTFGNNAQGGDIVCGLEITVRGELDIDRKKSELHRWAIGNLPFIGLGEPLYVYIGEGTYYPKGVDANWISSTCYQLGESSFGSLFAITRNFADDVGSLQTAAVLTLGDSFDLELTGKSLTTGKPLTEQGKYKEWVEPVEIKDFETQELPITWKETFYLQDVKVDDYEIYLRAVQQTVNNQESDRPFVFKIHRPVFGD